MITGVRLALAIGFAVVGPTGTGLTLVALGLALDWVDGQVARRTGTASRFGARFDMETDAFLIAVLSGYAAAAYGWWVLLIGAARYLLWLAERVAPWLRRPVPPRYWRKVVAAVQGIVLAVALSGLVPRAVASAALVVALALLAESFGRDVWWLWRCRTEPATAYPTGGGPTLVAIGVVWAALLLPAGPAGLLRVPAEALVLVGVALLPRGRRVAAALLGVLLAVLVVVHAMDRGFETFLDRPFDPVTDWHYLGPGVDVLGDSIGDPAAWATAALALVTVVALLVALPLATVRVAGSLARHRRPAYALGAACLVAPLLPLGSTAAGGLAVDEVRQVHTDLADQRAFAAEIDTDPYAGAPPDLRRLRGADVLVVFVESYGRVALDMPATSAAVTDGTSRLDASGWHTRSAFLTSPTFGAASWLAHSTLQSGLWVDSQRRYDQLLDADRTTLTSAFERAGWRTAFDVPANTRDWPEGQAFYGFDRLYDSRNVGYRGPESGYAKVPDQYTLSTFQDRELTGSPVFAEIDLVSSHHPWTPPPSLVPWDEVGDGTRLRPRAETLDDVRDKYDRNIAYSLTTLVSWLETQPDDDLVLLVLGDHQPHSYVTGPRPGHDVPVTVVARDPRVLRRIAGWGWRPGLRPSEDGPVWRMDAVRDRFLDAFSG
ncbi:MULTISPECIES: CDP-alcohol phosphatidyltransferase family protein [Nocardioides]|uniref:CDP-alcohol phosphatidyltransferase family protein n=1 Tax=Nocardioides TaxID=1839 RepID=UPI002867C0C2|nr:CDP-alcohol phosphatidyltransferase family protein [Nocardioides sp. CGMCC 1.13656]